MSLGNTIALLLEQNGWRWASGIHTHDAADNSIETGLKVVKHAFCAFAEAPGNLHMDESVVPHATIPSQITLSSHRPSGTNPVNYSSLLGYSGTPKDIVWIAIGE